jgi:AraC-like DNA-binding protein
MAEVAEVLEAVYFEQSPPHPDLRLFVGTASMPDGWYLKQTSDVAVVPHNRYMPVFVHAHDFIELMYIYAGSCRHFAAGSVVDMTAGDVGIVAPGTPHAVAVFDDKSLLINILVKRSTFDTAFLQLLTEDDVLSHFFTQLIYHPGRSAPYLFFRTGGDDYLRGLVEDLYREANEQKRYRSRMLHLLVTMFCTALIRAHESDVTVINPAGRGRDDRIVLALRFIQVNYATVTLKEAAERFSYTEPQLSRLIQSYTGRTFSEIVRGMRMREAAALLTNGQLSIQAIVERVGYADISHFYRSFKRQYGLTPMEFRRKMAAEGPKAELPY